jgi:ABC-type glucose/galactose transport system permease subunit
VHTTTKLLPSSGNRKGSRLKTILPIRLDLRLGAAGIITRRGRDLSPGATVMLAELREAATRLSRKAAKAR